jgi:pimeloyl-ACP methyl ester carboxylesterase
MTEPRDIELEIPEGTIAARRWGDPSGLPVLAAHGWLDNAGTFDRLAPRLDDVDLVSFDFPGHGRSHHRGAGAAYHFADWIPVFFDLADSLGWREFSILGHSMGAAAGALAAGTYPARIRRMVLIDGFGPWTTPEDEAPAQFREGLDERRTILSKNSRRYESREDAASTISTIYGMTPEAVMPLLNRGLERREDGWCMTYDLQLRAASMLRFTEGQVLAFLRRIDCPTLLIRPEEGWPWDAEQIRPRIDAVSDLTIEKVEGGHHVHLSSPTVLGGLVQAFLTPASESR